jgi:MoaA/NifB/PqqE/SkfB family radical SAM enzyme
MKLDEIGFYTLSDDRCRNASATSQLMRCELVLSNKCNFRCLYCRGQRADLQKDLTLTEAKKVIDYWEGVKNIRFSGGEPTLWNDLLDLVKYSKNKNIERIAISTNGSGDIDFYQKIVDAGVNDFSISLDACCACFGDRMAGTSGSWEKVVENIKQIAKLTYTTVGIVVTEENVHLLQDTVKFAIELGVKDVRIISAAQYNKLLKAVETIPFDLYKNFPILKYRIENTLNNINVRGISDCDSHKCWIGLDDMAVAGDYQFPCIIYLREQGNPIGKVGENMRRDREIWVKKHDTHLDEICKKNCLDCIVKYNNDYESFHG